MTENDKTINNTDKQQKIIDAILTLHADTIEKMAIDRLLYGQVYFSMNEKGDIEYVPVKDIYDDNQ